jgi:hypothetical protein
MNDVCTWILAGGIAALIAVGRLDEGRSSLCVKDVAATRRYHLFP